MDEAHKELVKRLRVTFTPMIGRKNMPVNPDGPEAALALESLAGEVEKWKQDAAWDKAAASDFLGRAEEAEAERDRLKAALRRIAGDADGYHEKGVFHTSAMVTIARNALGDAS